MANNIADDDFMKKLLADLVDDTSAANAGHGSAMVFDPFDDTLPDALDLSPARPQQTDTDMTDTTTAQHGQSGQLETATSQPDLGMSLDDIQALQRAIDPPLPPGYVMAPYVNPGQNQPPPGYSLASSDYRSFNAGFAQHQSQGSSQPSVFIPYNPSMASSAASTSRGTSRPQATGGRVRQVNTSAAFQSPTDFHIFNNPGYTIEDVPYYTTDEQLRGTSKSNWKPRCPIQDIKYWSVPVQALSQQDCERALYGGHIPQGQEQDDVELCAQYQLLYVNLMVEALRQPFQKTPLDRGNKARKLSDDDSRAKWTSWQTTGLEDMHRCINEEADASFLVNVCNALFHAVIDYHRSGFMRRAKKSANAEAQKMLCAERLIRIIKSMKAITRIRVDIVNLDYVNLIVAPDAELANKVDNFYTNANRAMVAKTKSSQLDALKSANASEVSTPTTPTSGYADSTASGRSYLQSGSATPTNRSELTIAPPKKVLFQGRERPSTNPLAGPSKTEMEAMAIAATAPAPVPAPVASMQQNQPLNPYPLSPYPLSQNSSARNSKHDLNDLGDNIDPALKRRRQ